jgi:hypothetical protein
VKGSDEKTGYLFDRDDFRFFSDRIILRSGEGKVSRSSQPGQGSQEKSI